MMVDRNQIKKIVKMVQLYKINKEIVGDIMNGKPFSRRD